MIIPITIFPPTTKLPNADIIEETASGPLCPSPKIDRVVAIFRDNLNNTRINKSVGKVDKSVGFCTNNDINRIKRPEVRDIIKKKSSSSFGNGTIIIASIEKTKPTSTYSFLNKSSFTPIQC